MGQYTLTRRALVAGLCGSAAVVTVQAPEPSATDPSQQDCAALGRYRDENARLMAGAASVEVVFLGDSLTEGRLSMAPKFFVAGHVCRGISGQTTPQMLLLFRQDVVDLRPRAVHVMAGTNDIAGNTGTATQKVIEDNFRSMTEIALTNGMRLVFGSVLPARAIPRNPGPSPAPRILALNLWLKSHAARVGGTYADYFAVLADGDGGMRAGLSFDEVHPTAAGFAAMRPVAEAALRRAQRPAR